jgi:hypothetical protein
MTSVSKYILDYMEDLLGREKYLSLRDFKRTIYNDMIKRIEFTNSLLSNFVITELNSSIKSTCVKIFQTIITFTDITRIDYIYSKIDLAKEIATLFSFEYDYIIALITRGKYGIPDLTEINKIFQIIVKRFLDISNEILVDFIFLLKNESSVVPFNPNPVNILLIEFLKSPIVPTNEFIQQMEKVNPGRSLNKGYIINCNYDEVKEYLNDNFVRNHIEIDSQRSDEWLDKMDFYTTGKNSGIVPFIGTTFTEWTRHYYNLCRGCSSEILMIDYCDFSKALSLDVVKFTCGLLVEKKEKNSIACAPDLLLIEKITKKVIPIEMKAIVGKPEYSHNFSREIKLARLQLSNSKNLLGQFYYGFSLIVIMFIYDGKFDVRYHNLDP